MKPDQQKGVSIFLRLLAAFLLVSIPVSGLLIYLAYSFNREAMETRTREHISQQLLTTVQRFGQEFATSLRRSVHSIASSTVLDDYLFASEEERVIIGKRLETQFDRWVEDYSHFSGIYFVDGDGVLILGAEDGKKIKAVRGIALVQDGNRLPGLSPTYAAVARLYQQMRSKPLLLSSGGMEWFMPPREIQTEGPFVDKEGRLSVIAAVAKLDLDTGAFGGVVLIRQRLDDFIKQLKEIQFFDENPVWLFDAEGEALHRPAKGAVTFNPAAYLPKGKAETAMIAATERGLVAYQDLDVLAGKPMFRVAFAIPSSLLYKDFGPATQFFLMVLIISIVATSCVAFYLSRYLSQPIVRLAAAVAKFANGNMSGRVDIKTTGEVQVLVDSFNTMMEQLRVTIAARDKSLVSLQREMARVEKLTAAKSQFLANMSHEIRTPMNGVLGMAELLERSDLDAGQRRHVNTILNSGRRLLEVINSILDFSRLEAGRMNIDVQTFDFHTLLGDVVQLMGIPAHQKGLELFYYLGEDVPRALRGDPLRLQQVLMNLLGNAVKFTENGRVHVNVSVAERHGKRVFLRVEVHDTGIGIKEQDQAKLFEAFEQADGSITRRFGGTGLGLAICRQLVELMDGKISLVSAPGQGSAFVFELPFKVGDETEEEREELDGILSGKTVVVAQKDPVARRILCKYLKCWNMRPVGAKSGMDVLEIIRGEKGPTGQVDLVVADDGLADMTGKDLIDCLKKDKGAHAPAVILLTPVGTAVNDAALNGSSPCVQVLKPYRPREMQSGIFQALGVAKRQAGNWAGAVFAGDAGVEMPRFDAKVLVAEDNPVNQELAREFLTELGCEVDVVDNGLDAVRAVKKGSYDIVFMDWQMPKMDGLESTRKIREYEAGRSLEPIAIVALTANAIEGDREECLANGMNSYLSKPFARADLMAVLSQLLGTGAQPSVMQKDTVETAKGGGADLLDQSVLAPFRKKSSSRGGSFLGRLVERYVESSDGDMAKLGLAVTQEDHVAAGLLAHKMKSGSAALGAFALAEKFSALQAAAREKDVRTIKKLFENIKTAHENVKDALLREGQNEDAQYLPDVDTAVSM